MSPPFRYKFNESDGVIEVHFVGRRRDVYELLGEHIEVVSKPWITPAGKAQTDSESVATSMGCEHFREDCNAAPRR